MANGPQRASFLNVQYFWTSSKCNPRWWNYWYYFSNWKEVQEDKSMWVSLTRVYGTHLKGNCLHMGIRLRTSPFGNPWKKEQMENYSPIFFCIFKFEQIIKDESKFKWANQKSLYNFNLGVIVKCGANQACQMLTQWKWKCVDIFFLRFYCCCQGC